MEKDTLILTKDQNDALQVVAKAFGWDRMSLDQIRLLAWSAFHYYVQRLR